MMICLMAYNAFHREKISAMMPALMNIHVVEVYEFAAVLSELVSTFSTPATDDDWETLQKGEYAPWE